MLPCRSPWSLRYRIRNHLARRQTVLEVTLPDMPFDQATLQQRFCPHVVHECRRLVEQGREVDVPQGLVARASDLGPRIWPAPRTIHPYDCAGEGRSALFA
jgi:hypothetical protein